METNERDFAGLSAALKEAAAAPPREPRRRHGAIRAAVRANLDALLAMRDNGFTEAEMADIFHAKGFKVSAATLRTYVNAERVARRGAQPGVGSRIRRTEKRLDRAQQPAADHIPPSVAAAHPPKPTDGDVALGHSLDDNY